MGVPQNGWVTMENPMRTYENGLFGGTPILGNPQMVLIKLKKHRDIIRPQASASACGGSKTRCDLLVPLDFHGKDWTTSPNRGVSINGGVNLVVIHFRWGFSFMKILGYPHLCLPPCVYTRGSNPSFSAIRCYKLCVCVCR